MSDTIYLILAVFAFMVGLMVGVYNAQGVEREEAIKAGVAEYYLDAHNEKQFRYKILGAM